MCTAEPFSPIANVYLHERLPVLRIANPPKKEKFLDSSPRLRRGYFVGDEELYEVSTQITIHVPQSVPSAEFARGVRICGKAVRQRLGREPSNTNVSGRYARRSPSGGGTQFDDYRRTFLKSKILGGTEKAITANGAGSARPFFRDVLLTFPTRT